MLSEGSACCSGICRLLSTKKFRPPAAKLVAERLFVQSLPQLLEFDLITALGGTQNTLCAGVSFIPELAAP